MHIAIHLGNIIRNFWQLQAVGGSTNPLYLSVLHVSVDWAPSLNQCVAKTSFLLALLLSIDHSTKYEVSSVKPGKFEKTLDGMRSKPRCHLQLQLQNHILPKYFPLIQESNFLRQPEEIRP